MKLRVAAFAVLGACLAVACTIAAAIAFGGPHRPPPLASIDEPFKAVDFSDVPPVRSFAARDGVRLAYRAYGAGGGDSVVLIHSSSARSNSMHPLAKALARAGYAVYALDMRGHGESGTKGTIAYVGQLEDDLEDFMNAVKPAGRKTLVGFSSGGGFALRFAGDRRQRMFDAYLLLSPWLHQNAPTNRRGLGRWVAVGMPRFVGIAVLNGFGVTCFNDLPVMDFALTDDARRFLTPSYSYALAMNFRPHDDYKADIRGAKQPMAVLAGSDDELFFADRFAVVFRDAGNPVPVGIVPGVGHVAITLSPAAIPAVVSSVAALAAPAH